jgi:hypothetical protein
MRRTPVIITLAGMAALAVTGTALAAAQDDGPSAVSGIGSAVDPSGAPTDDPTGDPTDDPTTEPVPDDSATSTRPPLSGEVDADEARRIALDQVGGGTVTEIESELEHGFATWKVEIVRDGVEHDIYVDRGSGAVIKADRKATDDRVADDRPADSPTHDARDDKGGDRGGHGADDGPGDDHGGDRDDDHDDDRGGDDHGGHGSDDDRGDDHSGRH